MPNEEMASPGDNLKSRLKRDCTVSLWAAAVGICCVAMVDYLATIIAFPGTISFSTLARLLFLEITLAVLIFFPVAVLMITAALLSRLAYVLYKPDTERYWQGLWKSQRGHSLRLSSILWGVFIASVGFLAGSALLTIKLSAMFKDPELTGLYIAVLQLFLALLFASLGFVFFLLVKKLGQKLDSILGIFNPFGSPPMASFILFLLGYGLIRGLFLLLPKMVPYIEMRHYLSLAAMVLGVYLANIVWDRAGQKNTQPFFLSRKALWPIGALLLIVPLTLFYIGADPNTKSMAISSSPFMTTAMNQVRRMTDFDKDGFGTLLGGNDCGPFDNKINPLARDIPDNGIDENCDGKDFKLGTLPSYRSGERMAVPEAFRGDWNFLLVTIDTVRYDHTSFGGYSRDTTPLLKDFADRSANFIFANAPSAGTMASIPAIITSKFFHSGIALNEDVPKGYPPKLKESNTLLSELFKKKGYRTGAILSHEYFNDWGMDQGVDDYDNSVGKKRAPKKVTSQLLTDRSIAWIGKQKQNKKWFLWVHYIDPHGYYVAHPGETSYGDSEMDLYDGELHFTDKHLARLLDYIARSQGNNKTVIAITSDHGDAFNEHGYINHGQDLHRELLHVPLIFYVPNIEPRNIPGAVSPIDIFPTFADLIGADYSDLNIEGQSLVPQLFYGKDAHDRLVFAETNYPKPQRAVINSRYKLILDMKNNVSRLWDLAKDPMEKKNIWNTDKEGYKEMRGYLNEWIERVVYARDAESNQAMAKLQEHLVKKIPTEAVPVKGVSWDEGKMALTAYEQNLNTVTPGGQVEFKLYFEAKQQTKIDMKFQIEAWLMSGPQAKRPAKSRLKITGGGMLPSSRWHPGEIVREKFKLGLPKSWKEAADKSKIEFGIRFVPKGQSTVSHTGTLRPGRKDLIVLGKFKLDNPRPSKEELEKAKAILPAPVKGQKQKATLVHPGKQK